ncbi:protein-L-isoaspartate O-methyltransferase family protein [Propionivibrio dicarboxylicus]|uniref:Protein-L-isoaspartate O-methyltransferase n=1 Tax=Propionivibrio dicarboxylicus TaxID=83767 RepID=A0A1G7VK70_9RHOO|nr:protein-L-isoaspartate O-methyltransferase [Propionivibrio dicarboxylicus]SDG60242.1 protein-L-isoaspartate(D-aspartate) O-methyltransferase [Propionivibrio dicarboxylicus]
MSVTPVSNETARFNMIQQQIRPWEVLDPVVLKLLSVVRREDFVPDAYRDLAFADVEIPLRPGEAQALPGQSMLAPRLEARILQELNIRNTDTVLEVGTGSGFMAALLAAKAEFVYSVEIDSELADQARANLANAGVVNVQVETGDGAQGWPAHAPYDVIVLSASTPVLPEAVLQQLKVGGRLIAVVGEAPAMQLQCVTRVNESSFATNGVLETVLAPLVNAPARKKFVF